MIVKATSADAKILTEIALKSKAFWGYSDAQIQEWKQDLTVSKKMIQEMLVFNFISDDKIAGFYILNQPKNKNIALEFLFVLPNFIAKGIGSKLINHAIDKAIELKSKTIQLLADPNAVSFYQSKKFMIFDKKESSISGRFLPIMQRDL